MKIAGYSIPVIIFSTLVLACSGGQPEEEEQQQNQPPMMYRLECTGGQAIRSQIKRENNALIERGPVALPAGVTCDQMKSKPENQIKALKRTGEWNNFIEGTTVVGGRGNYQDDKRTGEWRFFNEQSQLTRVSHYAEGKKEGEEISYFPGANEWSRRGQYANNLATGHWQERPNVHSDCVSEGEMSEGKKSGRWKECDQEKSGRFYIAFEGGYEHGLRNGPAVVHFPDGSNQAEGQYSADLECQKQPPKEGEETCGRRSGRWRIYYQGGNLAMEGEYDPRNGLKTGVWTEYYKSGQKMGEGPRENRRNGEWTFYNKDGSILAKFVFNQNEFMASVGEFYAGGRITGRGGLTNMLVQYEEASDSIRLGTIFKNGPWVEYYPSGQKSGEGSYTMNKKNGRWIHYAENGRKTMEGTYNMDIRNGDWILYDEAGRVQSQGTYMMGKKNGQWREYQNGTLVRTLSCSLDRCQ